MAQTKTAANTSSAKTTSNNSSDSLKQAVANLKTSFNTLFSGKKDTINITVTDVDYDDSDLTRLKENIKNIKGAKTVSEQYKSGNAIVKVLYKGTSTALWDELPADTRKPFKLTDASDNSISVKFKVAKTTQ